MKTKTNFSSLLKHKGLKVTKHRNSVLEVIENSAQPLTAEDIYITLKQENISINLSSVYRILDILVSNSLINKCNFDENNKTLYEINTADHKHHLICSNCKKVFPIDVCPLSKFQSDIEVTMDFEITSHKLELYGFCKDCKNNIKTS